MNLENVSKFRRLLDNHTCPPLDKWTASGERLRYHYHDIEFNNRTFRVRHYQNVDDEKTVYPLNIEAVFETYLDAASLSLAAGLVIE